MPASYAVLLSGMMCDERMWSEQIAALDIPVSVADMSNNDSISAMAESVLATAPNQFALAGLSMGGILAFEIWRQAPGRITHLMLMDTNPHPDTADRQTLRLQQIDDVLSGGLRSVAVESLKPLYLAEKHRDDEQLLGTILDMALDLGPEVFKRQSIALINRPDSVPTLSTISCPTTVMCGREDTLCPMNFHELMASEIADATLTVIDNCGHLATMEQPHIVNREMQQLFSQ